MKIPRSLPALAAVAAALAAAPLRAQAHPAGWETTPLTAAPVDSASFVTMPPGWHVTLPASAALANPEHTAADSVSSTFFLFSSAPGTGFGVSVGGPGRRTAFVVGPDGRYRITRHGPRGGSREIRPWTEHAAVARHPGGEANVRQRVSVAARGTDVVFSVNGQEVAVLPRAEAEVSGAAGFHAEGAVNVHAATLELDGRNVAPTPPAP